jgi:hypothetical protein
MQYAPVGVFLSSTLTGTKIVGKLHLQQLSSPSSKLGKQPGDYGSALWSHYAIRMQIGMPH